MDLKKQVSGVGCRRPQTCHIGFQYLQYELHIDCLCYKEAEAGRQHASLQPVFMKLIEVIREKDKRGDNTADI